jgi:hypothetical protein
VFVGGTRPGHPGALVVPLLVSTPVIRAGACALQPAAAAVGALPMLVHTVVFTGRDDGEQPPP